MALLNQITL